MEHKKLLVSFIDTSERLEQQFELQPGPSYAEILKECLCIGIDFSIAHAPQVYVKASGKTKDSGPMLSRIVKQTLRKISVKYKDDIDKNNYIDIPTLIAKCYEEIALILQQLTSRGMREYNYQLCEHSKELTIQALRRYKILA